MIPFPSSSVYLATLVALSLIIPLRIPHVSITSVILDFFLVNVMLWSLLLGYLGMTLTSPLSQDHPHGIERARLRVMLTRTCPWPIGVDAYLRQVCGSIRRLGNVLELLRINRGTSGTRECDLAAIEDPQ
ncbi:hypothetical protein L226DRAFT_29736 [Lentinus tigrinus ALCF2SS1-7]|uniref:uncharacterized protein n=1 Tax=Lentinus tigrinus ALCF2SS1-7 TaxID=1328758 RepID=UPI0011660679|nr:hypothetical protein L226DRAFT_29736 [Lentinus tigrinus ALCF2SS1-7]